MSSVFSHTPKTTADLFHLKFMKELCQRSDQPSSDMVGLNQIKTKIDKGSKHSDIKKSTLINLLETFVKLIPDWESALEKTGKELYSKNQKILEMEEEMGKLVKLRFDVGMPVEKKNEGCQVAVSQEEVHGSTEERKRNRKQTCVFFKKGICKFGPTGQNAEGTCSFLHPSTCPSFELFGWKTRWGCKKKNCRLLHRICCRKYMSCGTCDLEKGKCQYYHPPELKNIKWLWKDRPGRSPQRGQDRQGINVELLIRSLVEIIKDGTKENGQTGDGSCMQVKKGSKNPRGK